MELSITKFILGAVESQWEYRDISNELPMQHDAWHCGPLSALNCDYLVRSQPFNYHINEIISKLRFNICLSVILQDYHLFHQ